MIAFQVLLPIIAPLIDLYAICGIEFTDPLPVIASWPAFKSPSSPSRSSPSASTASR